MSMERASTDTPSADRVVACEGRRPGRPREQRADKAIIDAPLEIFADEGYHALSMEAVAARAEVSKATIYRRWPGKRELVIDALATMNDGFPKVPELGEKSTRDWLLMALRYLANRDSTSLAGRIMPRMMTYSISQPDLYAEYFERVITPRRQWLRTVLEHGIERGELRADLDVEVASVAISAPAVLHAKGMGQPQLTDFPERLLNVLWPGLRAIVTVDADGRT